MPIVTNMEVRPSDSVRTAGQDFPKRLMVSSLVSETELFEQSLTFGSCVLTTC